MLPEKLPDMDFVKCASITTHKCFSKKYVLLTYNTDRSNIQILQMKLSSGFWNWIYFFKGAAPNNH